MVCLEAEVIEVASGGRGMSSCRREKSAVCAEYKCRWGHCEKPSVEFYDGLQLQRDVAAPTLLRLWGERAR